MIKLLGPLALAQRYSGHNGMAIADLCILRAMASSTISDIKRAYGLIWT
jgi:hypothetical protein